MRSVEVSLLHDAASPADIGNLGGRSATLNPLNPKLQALNPRPRRKVIDTSTLITGMKSQS